MLRSTVRCVVSYPSSLTANRPPACCGQGSGQSGQGQHAGRIQRTSTRLCRAATACRGRTL